MSNRKVKNYILIAILAVYLVIYKLLIFPKYMGVSEIVNTSFLVAYLGLAIKFLGYRKDKSSFDSKNIVRSVLLYIFLTFLAMYGLGCVVGFLKNAYSRNTFTLIQNIFLPILTIIFCELIRYVLIWANRDKKFIVCIFTGLLCLFELFISIRSLPLNNVEEMFNLIATIILPVIIKNCVMSYLCYHIGYKVPILYRLIMDVYVFVVPFVPDIGDYLNSMILIALPIIIYISAFSYIDDRKKQVDYFFEEEKFSFWDIPVAVFLITLAILVSGFFPHYMIGVGSDSMRPAINKGDAIILKKVTEKTKLKKGDIVAFTNEDNTRTIVHRIDEISQANGRTAYVTKGDANNGVDSNVVTISQIKGVVKVKIPFIAYPTVWLTDFFRKD